MQENENAILNSVNIQNIPSDEIERRTLRARYRTLAKNATEQKDAMVRVDGIALRQCLDAADAEFSKVKKAREQVLDSQLLCQLSAYGVELAKKLGAGAASAMSAKDLTTRLKLFCVRGVDPINAPVDNPAAFDWEKLATTPAARFLVRPAVTFSCMNGPMDVQIKERKVAQRRAKTVVGEAVNPGTMDNNTKTEEEEQREITALMRTVFKVLKNEYKTNGNKGVLLADLVCNRDSFAQTVENLFAASFLVRDGDIRLSDSDEGIVAKPTQKPKESDWASGTAHAAQFVVNFSPADWKEMKEHVGRQMMAHRQPVPQAKRARAGDGEAEKVSKRKK